jgi:hypothetical protein
MTRADYERHLEGLGYWAELLPPWPVLEEAMSAMRGGEIKGPSVLISAADTAMIALAIMEKALTIARALLAETSLTPSEVRARWPAEALWLLEREG